MKLPWVKRTAAVSVKTNSTEPDNIEAEFTQHLMYLRETVWESIAPGFQTKADVTSSTIELVEDDDDNPLSAKDAIELVDELWEFRLRQLASALPAGPGDDERVAAVFAELESSGIAASMYLGWDQTEGVDLSYERAVALGLTVGYVFFHFQDAERLAHSDPALFLAYGSLERDKAKRPAADVRVGELVRDATIRHGLTVDWDGTLSRRIVITGLDWRRPLPTGS